MFKKSAFPHVMLFFIALIMVSIMATVMTLVNTGTIVFPELLKSIGIGMVIAIVLGELVPVIKWADAFAIGLCKRKPGSLGHILLQNLIMSLFYGIIMSLIFTYIGIGYPPYFWKAWLGGLPLGMLVGYVAGLVAGVVSNKIATALCSKE